MSDTMQRLRAALADRYRIERELGAGGMATVYLAHDLRHDRDVAIKVLHSDLGAALGSERFLSEIKTTARLQHPHILPLLDSGDADGLLFYVMPVVTGEPLRARLERERQLPIDDAVLVAREVADALGYAHTLGVIHRDIKPENILLQNGHALVADFGIALAVQSAAGQRMTQTGLSLGTPQYMSPEQAMGERTIDARSDIYALGAVTYEMLVGEPPFTGPSVQAIVARLVSEEPRPISVQRKAVPDDVESAVLRALEKLPADRFATATAFAEALGNGALTGGTRGGRTRSRGTRASTASQAPARTLRVPLVAVIAVVALALGAAAAAFVTRGRGGLRDVTRVSLQLPATQEVRAALGTPFMAVPPDGSGVLYVGPGATTRTQFWMRRWDRLQAERLTRTVDEGCCATFSPSGDTIAYLATPSQLNILPLTGGVPTTLAGSDVISVSDVGGGLDWSPDGWLYAIGADGLIRLDPRRGTRTLVAPPDTVRGDLFFLWPHVLPGAKGALVTVVSKQSPFDPERASIGVADFASGRVEIIQQGVRAIYAPTGHVIVARASGVLWAVPFDARALRSTGPARELADTVVVRAGHAAPGIVDLALAPNGTLTYLAGGEGTFHAAWVDRSGAWQPLSDSARGVVMDAVALSPDGRRVVLSMGGEDRNANLWLHPADGGPGVRLTFDGTVNIRALWRPRTSRLSFHSDRDQMGVARSLGLHLFERDASGQGRVRRYALGDARKVGGHAWSPDGQWLVFRTDDQERGSGDILAIRPDVDTVPRVLVATPAEELAPAVSPDGRWFAYTSNESGRREVYVRPFPQNGDTRYQVSTAGGVTPVWHRNGRELFFVDAAQQMVSVPVTTAEEFAAGQSRVLFSVADYYITPYAAQFDVSPDGRFVMIRREKSAEFRIVAVFNFLEELKRRMAAK